MIPGLTTRNRLPRLGKIRLGEKRQTQRGTEYPAALDHFNFSDVPEVAEMYGADCREISPVILPAEDEEIWFPTARKAYRKSGLFCACDDGETARRVYIPVEGKEKGDPQGEEYVKAEGLKVEPGEMFEMPCHGETCPYFEQALCKNVGRLLFMLPRVPRFGVYEIATSSHNGILNVLSTARSIRALAGRIAGIPLALRLGPQQVQVEGKAKTVHVLSLEFRGSLWDLQRAKAQLAGGRVVALIEGGTDVTPDDLYPAGGAALDRRLGGRTIRTPNGHTVDTGTGEIIEEDASGFEAPPPAPAEPIIVCGCPCGDQREVTAEVARITTEATGSPRCGACYPWNPKYQAKAHAALKNMEIPKYPLLTGEGAATQHQAFLDAQRRKSAGGAR